MYAHASIPLEAELSGASLRPLLLKFHFPEGDKRKHAGKTKECDDVKKNVMQPVAVRHDSHEGVDRVCVGREV